MFPALQHRNFRLLWVGLLISFSGSYMQSAAILWHVSLLVPDDRRALALGMVGLVRVVPIVVFSLISGVAADALDRRKLMLLTQSTMAVLAAILFAVTYHGLAVVWPIYVLAAASSAAGAFDLPARQSMVPSLVPREHLPERDQPEHEHGAGGLGGRPGVGRGGHRHCRRGLGLCRATRSRTWWSSSRC